MIAGLTRQNDEDGVRSGFLFPARLEFSILLFGWLAVDAAMALSVLLSCLADASPCMWINEEVIPLIHLPVNGANVFTSKCSRSI